MWGAVIGDIAGSRFEGSRGGPKSFEFFHQHCRYTDDTVCTAAVADIIVNDHRPDSTLQAWCRRHPGRGYGGNFRKWIASTAPTPYGSFGTERRCGSRPLRSSTEDGHSRKRSRQATASRKSRTTIPKASREPEP